MASASFGLTRRAMDTQAELNDIARASTRAPSERRAPRQIVWQYTNTGRLHFRCPTPASATGGTTPTPEYDPTMRDLDAIAISSVRTRGASKRGGRDRRGPSALPELTSGAPALWAEDASLVTRGERGPGRARVVPAEASEADEPAAALGGATPAEGPASARGCRSSAGASAVRAQSARGSRRSTLVTCGHSVLQ